MGAPTIRNAVQRDPDYEALKFFVQRLESVDEEMVRAAAAPFLDMENYVKVRLLYER